MGCEKSKNKNKSSNNENNKQLKIQNLNSNKEFESKIILLGEAGVGKSSIVQRFCNAIFQDKYKTTIAGAFFQQTIKLKDNNTIKLQIWDTSGDEKFRNMTHLYFNGAQGAILTYEVTDLESLEKLDYWIKELSQNCDINNMVLCLAGNKCDVDNDKRRVSYGKGKEFANNNNLIFFETSAKMDIGIKELFNNIANRLYDKILKK